MRLVKAIARHILGAELKDLRFQRDAANSKRKLAHQQNAKDLARLERQRDDLKRDLRAADDRAAEFEKKARNCQRELKNERDAHITVARRAEER